MQNFIAKRKTAKALGVAQRETWVTTGGAKGAGPPLKDGAPARLPGTRLGTEVNFPACSELPRPPACLSSSLSTISPCKETPPEQVSQFI